MLLAPITVSRPLTGHTGRVYSVAFGTRPGGRLLLASGSHFDAKVRLWDPASGTPVDRLAGHTGWLYSVAFGTGPDGRLVLASASNDQTVRLWDPDAGTSVGLTGHTGTVTSVAFGTGPDGRLRLASASKDQTVRLWDPDAGTSVGLTGHTGTVTSVAFGTGRMAACGWPPPAKTRRSGYGTQTPRRKLPNSSVDQPLCQWRPPIAFSLSVITKGSP
jgi:WD40 repeat protein